MNYDNYKDSFDDISFFSVNRFLYTEPSIQPLKSPRIEYVQTGDDRKIAYKIAVMKERRRREDVYFENLKACQESRKRKCVDDEYEWAASRKKFKTSFVASDSASEDEVKTWRVIKTPQWHRRAIPIDIMRCPMFFAIMIIYYSGIGLLEIIFRTGNIDYWEDVIADIGLTLSSRHPLASLSANIESTQWFA
ncbi:hypothetical protein BC829DRAFT_422825 [Chytridium lagenaria]|nr:hypothetical protein BC829DRAFT_422825 [Chytridium lagenaria]